MLNKLKIDDVIKILLFNRGLKTKKEIDEFLNPKLSDVTVASVGIDKTQLKKAVSRIQKAIENKEQIVVFGDYDVDGICGAAILWETLHSLGAKVMPYIPHRIDEGYGLSIKGIENITKRYTLEAKRSLIITVDNGIVANTAVDFANKNGIDVIITDHHVPGKKLPRAQAIFHTTKLCGAGVAWVLSRECHSESAAGGTKNLKRSFAGAQDDNEEETHLELVALATIADLVPLLGGNRTLTKYGLEQLRKTKRVGLLELFKESGLDPDKIGAYEVGHLIAPRLNAMGRLESAMESLRLLCTKNRERAVALAHLVGSTNKERQVVTEETILHAKEFVRGQRLEVKKLLFVSHESYQQGVIGLIAGKLVEEFYRPSIVVAIGEKTSKASARSVKGFNIIEFIRSASELLVDVGGHPMAAGFTVETAKLSLLEEKLTTLADKLVDDELLIRTLNIDCEIDLAYVTKTFYEQLQALEPFGMANPQPTFVSRKVIIEDMRLVGNGGKHIKLKVQSEKFKIDAIAFGFGKRAGEFHVGDAVDIVYTIEENVWNGSSKLQLKIKDMKLSLSKSKV